MEKVQLSRNDNMIPKSITFNIFSSHYLPHVGGIEAYVAHFSQGLAKQGYKVNIITSNSDHLQFKEKEGNVIVYRMKSLSLLSNRYPVPYSLYELKTIYKECFKRKSSVTVVNTRYFLTSLLGLLFAAASHNKRLLIEHGSAHITYANPILNTCSHLYEHFMTWILRLFRPDFFGVSQACNEWLKHFGIKAKGVIYNGVDTNFKWDTHLDVRKKYNLRKDKLILYPTRFIKEKGILELIDAFIIFSKRHSGFNLVLAGGGELEDELKAIAKKHTNITFVGRLPKEEVYAIFSESRYFVNPTNYPEGLTTVLLEASSFGLPTITTPNGGAPEIIKHGITGLIIPKGTVGNILKSLEYFEKNPTKARLMGREVEKVIKEKFDWDMIVKTFLSSYTI